MFGMSVCAIEGRGELRDMAVILWCAALRVQAKSVVFPTGSAFYSRMKMVRGGGTKNGAAVV